MAFLPLITYLKSNKNGSVIKINSQKMKNQTINKVIQLLLVANCSIQLFKQRPARSCEFRTSKLEVIHLDKMELIIKKLKNTIVVRRPPLFLRGIENGVEITTNKPQTLYRTYNPSKILLKMFTMTRNKVSINACDPRYKSLVLCNFKVNKLFMV